MNIKHIPTISLKYHFLQAYPSMKPLAAWTRDLVTRVEQFSKWATIARPPWVFWMSAFTFPTGFLTAVLQTAARQNQVRDLQTHLYRIELTELETKCEMVSTKTMNGLITLYRNRTILCLRYKFRINFLLRCCWCINEDIYASNILTQCNKCCSGGSNMIIKKTFWLCFSLHIHAHYLLFICYQKIDIGVFCLTLNKDDH